MANSCDTVVQFRGDERALNDLLGRISTKPLRELAADFEITEGEAANTSCDRSPFRGDVIDVDKSAYRLYQDDAWVPHVALWSVVCEKIYGNKISFVYKAEEPGDNIFINTDDSGLFFPEKFVCDYCFRGQSDVEYFPDEQCFLHWLNKTFDIDANTVNNAETVIIDKFVDDDEYITIGHFRDRF